MKGKSGQLKKWLPWFKVSQVAEQILVLLKLENGIQYHTMCVCE